MDTHSLLAASGLRTLRISLGVVLLASMALFAWQRKLIYYPWKMEPAEEAARATAAGLLPWKAGDRRFGWYRPGSGRRVLVLHGNAGSAVNRDYLADRIQSAAAQNDPAIYILEYPGYGHRPGSPSQASLVQAALEAMDELLQTDTSPLLLVGESLGTGVACQAAALRPDAVSGLLLITPFNSLTAVARHHYPWLPIGWILRDRYESDLALRQYTGPLVILLAGQDRVVPAALGEKLAQDYEGPTLILRKDQADHNDLLSYLSPGEWREAWQFLEP